MRIGVIWNRMKREARGQMSTDSPEYICPILGIDTHSLFLFLPTRERQVDSYVSLISFRQSWTVFNYLTIPQSEEVSALLPSQQSTVTNASRNLLLDQRSVVASDTIVCRSASSESHAIL